MSDDAFEVLSIDETTELLVAAGQNLLPEDDFSPESDEYKRTRARAGAVADTHAHIQVAVRDALPDTARGKRLEGWGGLVKKPRKGGSPASGEDAGLVRGAAGASWATTDALVHTSGRRYFPTSSGTLGASGEALAGVIAEEGGSDGKLDEGEVLTWESTPPGLEDEVELQAPLADGGTDAEGEGPYRNRILDRIAEGARGGTAADWEAWILEAADYIASAYVWPNRNGLGSVDVAALRAGRGSARILTAAERSDLADHVNARRSVHVGDVRALETLEETVDVEMHIEPARQDRWKRDWNDSTPPEISAWDSATRTITFTAARPDSMAAGHRLIIAGTDGTELEIESLSGTSAVVVVQARGLAPAAGQLVYSGGPLITPVRNALLALIDALGPRHGSYGAGTWRSSLLLSQLTKAALDVEGVHDRAVIAPAADVEPTATAYPFDGQVYFLSPGNVFVRYEDL